MILAFSSPLRETGLGVSRILSEPLNKQLQRKIKRLVYPERYLAD